MAAILAAMLATTAEGAADGALLGNGRADAIASVATIAGTELAATAADG